MAKKKKPEEGFERYEQFKRSYNNALSSWSAYWQEAYTDLQFFMGDQWDNSTKNRLLNEGRTPYVYNYCKRVVKMVTGYQRKNRLSLEVRPQENNDQEIADILSDLLLWQLQYSNGYHTISEAFEGACVSGINLLEVWIDFSKDLVNGEIKIDRLPFNSWILDPLFTKNDLSDCRFVIRRKYVHKDEAKSLIPEKEEEIDNIVQTTGSDGMFSYMNMNINRMDKDLVAYDEYWTRTKKKIKVIVDQSTGDYQEWKGNKEALEIYLREFPWVKEQEIYKPTVELSVFVGGRWMKTEEDPYGISDYPFIPVIAYYQPELDDYRYKLQGVVRSMRDPQEDFNKRRSTANDILESQINSGWIVKNGAIDNPLDITKTGQGAIIFRSRNSNPDDLTKIIPSEVSQSTFQLMAQSEKDILQISGANEELLGIADQGNTEISGVLAKVRSANSLTTLQDLFDNLALSQKILGEKVVKLMQNNFTPMKIFRITNKQPPDELFTKDFSKYDMVVAEGLLTDTQKALHYAQLLQAKAIGIPIPDSAIINALPIQGKSDLMEEFAKEQQQQQKLAQEIEEQKIIEQKLKNSEIINNLSLAAERRSRMVADEGLARERISEAQLNRIKAVIDQIKAIKELEEIDRTRLIENIQFLSGMQSFSTEETKSDVQEASNRAMEQVLLTSQLGQVQNPVPQEQQIPGNDGTIPMQDGSGVGDGVIGGLPFGDMPMGQEIGLQPGELS